MERLSDYIYTMHSCNQCGQCKWILGPKMRGWRYAEVCPIHQRFNFDAYSGQGIINIAQEILEGRLKCDRDLIRLIYTCLTCGACDVNCKSIRDMEVLDTILALRAKCVEDGWAPLPEHRELADRIERHRNVYGLSQDRRFDWLPESAETQANSTVAYFSGCSSAYKHPEIALSSVKLLTACGVEFKILGKEEYCCGVSLWRTGQISAFQKMVEQNMEIFHQQGIKTIITSCAECFGTFRGGYARFANMDVEVLHITQVVQQALRDERIKPRRVAGMKVTYHDPCFLGRLSEKYIPWQGEIQAFGLHVPPKPWRRGTFGVYEAPREVLRSIPGIELAEMPRNAENSYCCGAGGGVSSAFPGFGEWVAGERLDEARSTEADTLVSCCPHCKESFHRAIEVSDNGMSYFDFTELLVQSVG